MVTYPGSPARLKRIAFPKTPAAHLATPRRRHSPSPSKVPTRNPLEVPEPEDIFGTLYRLADEQNPGLTWDTLASLLIKCDDCPLIMTKSAWGKYHGAHCVGRQEMTEEL